MMKRVFSAAAIVCILVSAGSVLGVQPDNVELGSKANNTPPYFYASFDNAGYSDEGIYYCQSPTHPFPCHELLSGEWGAAIHYDGIETGNKAMWLTNKFYFPNWETNSNFVTKTTGSDSDNASNPVSGVSDTGNSVIKNNKLEIAIDYEIADLGENGYSPMAAIDPVSGTSGYAKSDRYVFLQTYTIKNISSSDIDNVEFYQMLHSHGANVYGPNVNSIYNTYAYPDDLENYTPFNQVHAVGSFRYDITQWNSSPESHIDYVGFSSTVEPDSFENGHFRGGHSYDENNKPATGTHVNIENRTLNEETGIFNDEVAGAMKWNLGTLAPAESISMTFAFMFGHNEVFEGSLLLDKYDNVSDDPNLSCGIDPASSDPNDYTVTYTIDYGNPETNELSSNYLGTVTDVVLKDILPSGKYNLMTVQYSTGGQFSMMDGTDTVTWNIGTLEPGETGSVWVQVEFTMEAEPGGQVINEAILDSSVGSITDIEYTDVCCWDSSGVLFVKALADPNSPEPGGNGTSWSTAYKDLNQALVRAGKCGSDIWLSSGIYKLDEKAHITFTIPDGVRLYGGFAGTETSLDERDFIKHKTIFTCAGMNKNVVTMGQDALLDGIVIEKGDDRGIYGKDVNFTLSNCTVQSNFKNGIYAENGNVVIKNCIIRNNRYDGIYSSDFGNRLTVENSKIFDNKQNGINCYKSTATILNSEIHHNGTDTSGDYYGINFTSPSSKPLIRNCTIVNNRLYGITCPGYSTKKPTVINCIVWGNNGATIHRQIRGYSEVTYSCVNDIDGEGNISADPIFVYGDPNSMNLHLAWDSPCKDAGSNYAVDPNAVGLEEYDIDMQERIYGGVNVGTVDIGADEVTCSDLLSEFDENDDLIVNYIDFAGFANSWGMTNNNPNWNDTHSKYDYVADNVIDIADLDYWTYEWLWEPCWLEGNGSVYDRYVAQPAAAQQSSSGMPMGQESIAAESQSVEENFFTSKEIIEFFESLLEDEEVLKLIDRKDLKKFIKSLESALFTDLP